MKGTGLVYYETDAFVAQTAQAVKAILDMELGDDQGRVHVKFVDWVKLDGPAPMTVTNNWELTYVQSYGRYESQSHCVVLVESPPVFGEGVLGVANKCFYCNSANVAFVTNDNVDAWTYVTIAHEIGHLLCGSHTSTGIMNAYIGGSEDFNSFSEDSEQEISQRLQETDYGGETCMAEFNGTTTRPHSEYICDNEGHCYRKDHTHDDGAMVFLISFMLYFIFLGFILIWPLEYHFDYQKLDTKM